MTFDLILAGGQLLDGTGTPAVAADLGIIGEKIEAIANLSRAQARRVIPLQGLTLAPGFIDTHTHSEGTLLHDPQHANGLRQGITTEIVGLDGMSWAPLSPPNYRLYARYLGGILGDPPPELDMSSIAAFRAHYHRKVAVNVAYLVPHGALRLELLGFRDLPLRGAKLQAAGQMVRQGIEQGAVGFSTGAAYYPGYWADTRELVELCRAVGEAGGVYVNEPRVGTPERAFGGGGILEGLEIARQSGAPVHFAHLRTTEQTAGRLQELTAPIDRAQAQGVDCTMDIYPYPSGSSIAVSFLPGDMQEGGPDAILERLADPGRRRAIEDHLENRLFAPLEPVTFSYPMFEGFGVGHGRKSLKMIHEGVILPFYVVTISTDYDRFIFLTFFIYWAIIAGDIESPCTSAKSRSAPPMVKPINTSVFRKPFVNVCPAAAPVTVNASCAISAVWT